MDLRRTVEKILAKGRVLMSALHSAEVGDHHLDVGALRASKAAEHRAQLVIARMGRTDEAGHLFGHTGIDQLPRQQVD